MNHDFEALRAFLAKTSGLSIGADKRYLVESRLSPILRPAGVESLRDLMQRLESGAYPDLVQDVIEAMTTNETFFFRDRAPFDIFRDVMLPQLMQERSARKHIRIWCAACSTGQEPYSLAMTLDEAGKQLAGWRVDILATDLSRHAVASAEQATYSQFEVQRGLPISTLLRYFHQEGERWQLNEYLRSRVRFKTFNLLSDFRSLGQFDVIFCRNVLIYFGVETKKDVLTRLAPALSRDGYLVLGSAETVVGLSDAFMPHPDHHSICVHRPKGHSFRPPLKLVAAG